MLDLVGDRRAVGVAHPRQRVEQGLALDADPQDRGRDLRHQLGSEVEVLGLERRIALRLAAERVDAGCQVAVGAVGLEQRGRGLDRLQDLAVGLRADDAAGRRRRCGARQRRCRRGGRHGRCVTRFGAILERLGDGLVEAVLALEQLVDPAQERARLGALDDPVVVGGRHRHHLRDAERLDLLRRGVGPLGRVGDRAGGDDRPLAVHQPRHRRDRAEAAGVGQRDVRALEVVGGELVLARLGDQLLVGGVEAGEVEPVGALDAGHEQAAPAAALDVDGDPEVDVLVLDHLRLAVLLDVRARHHRPVGGGSDDRPRDQVGEGDLHPALAQGGVERLALGVEDVHGQGAERGRGRHRPALVHRLGEDRGRAAQRLALAAIDGRGRRAGAVGGRQDVLLDDLAAGPGALHGADVEALGGGDAAGDGGGAAVAGVGRCGWLRRWLIAARRSPPRHSAVERSAPVAISARAWPTWTVSSRETSSFVIVPAAGGRAPRRRSCRWRPRRPCRPRRRCRPPRRATRDGALGDRLAHLRHRVRPRSRPPGASGAAATSI